VVVKAGFADFSDGGTAAFGPFVDLVAAGVGGVVVLAHFGLCGRRLLVVAVAFVLGLELWWRG